MVILFCLAARAQTADDADSFKFTADFYGSHADLMQYKGTQDDFSATLYLQYQTYRLVPFLRFLTSHYYYKVPALADRVSDRRIAVGAGLDFRINDYLRLRAISESINDRVSARTYNQQSYGVIYNQYIKAEALEFNNYLESFLIPRIAQNKLDTFARGQVFHSFYVHTAPGLSHVLFPFAQVKVKVNDDAIFGLSGQAVSLGGGYKFFKQNSKDDNIAVLLEGHSVIYQSKDFSADWFQVLAAVQWMTN